MRIDCPLCGPRDRREFTYKGHALALDRPNPQAGVRDWNDYLHNRENPAGVTRDLWSHDMGCSAWLVVTRDTVSHLVHKVELASAVKETAK